MFVFFTGLAALALRFLDPPHAKPTLPGQLAADAQDKRSRRHIIIGRLKREPCITTSAGSGLSCYGMKGRDSRAGRQHRIGYLLLPQRQACRPFALQ